jgi:hypothetical protein
MAQLSNEDILKIKDLRKIYGKLGASDLINIEHSLIESAVAESNLEDKDCKQIHFRIRLYWRKWMGEHRI